jgi:predicted DCC family thiol-disulfide oxidoreductase YuxK
MALVSVLYDRDCGFCRWSMDKILWWDRRRRLHPVPLQSDEADALLPQGMDRATRMGSWHLVTADGEVHSGGDAAPHLFRLLPGGRPLAILTSTFPKLTEHLYRWVSDHRDTFARFIGSRVCRVDPARRR